MQSVALFVVALCVGSTEVAAQSDDCIFIYIDGMHLGTNLKVCKSIPDLSLASNLGFDNEVSSVAFGANIHSVVLFDEANYQGEFALTTESFNNTDFNDRASSIHLNFNTLTEVPDARCIRLFNMTAFRGVSTQLCQDAPDLARFGFDNTARSMSLGSEVSLATVFNWANYSGQEHSVRSSVRNFNTELIFNTHTTSVRFYLDNIRRFNVNDTCTNNQANANGAFQCDSGGDCKITCEESGCKNCNIIGPESPFRLTVDCASSACDDLKVVGASSILCEESACSMAAFGCGVDDTCSLNCTGASACSGVTLDCPQYAGCNVSCDGDGDDPCSDLTVNREAHLPFRYDIDGSSTCPLGEGSWCSSSCQSSEWECPPVLSPTTQCVDSPDECPVTSCAWDEGCGTSECRSVVLTNDRYRCANETDDVVGVCDNGFEHCLAHIGQAEQVGCPWDTCIGQAGVCKDLETGICEDLAGGGSCASGYTHCDEYDGGPHYSAIDGCPSNNVVIQGQCLSQLEFAAVRCCTTNATTSEVNGCNSYCPEGTAARPANSPLATETLLMTYEDAKALCEGQGERLCANADELSLCCNTGCNHNRRPSWISETCDPGSPLTSSPTPGPTPDLTPSPTPAVTPPPTPESTMVPTITSSTMSTRPPVTATLPPLPSVPLGTVVPTPPPSGEDLDFEVEIVPAEPVDNVNPGEEYTIGSRVVALSGATAPSPAAVGRRWLTLTKLGAAGADEDEVIDFETQRSALVTGNTGQAIKIARGVLAPGSEYEVSLAYFQRTPTTIPQGTGTTQAPGGMPTPTNGQPGIGGGTQPQQQQGVEVIATARFRTNSPPSGGVCSVSPDEGMALSTSFEFACDGWDDADAPGGALEYSFSLVAADASSSGDEGRALTQFRAFATHDAVLASPNVVADGVWRVFARIRDSFGAVTVYDIGSISVTSPLGPTLFPASREDIVDLTRNTIDSTLSATNGDVDETLSVVESLAEILNAAPALAGTNDPDGALEAAMVRHELFRIATDASPANVGNGLRRNDEIELALRSVQPLLGTTDEVSIDLRDDASLYLISCASEAVRGEQSDAGISDSLSQVSLNMLSRLVRVQEAEAESLTTRLLSHPQHSRQLQSLRHPEHVKAQARRKGTNTEGTEGERRQMQLEDTSGELLQRGTDDESTSAFNAERTFSRDFDWTVYLVSRGSLRTKIAEEAPTVIEAEGITLLVSKELTTEYARTFNANGTAITFPATTLFNESADPSVVDFSMVVYRGTSLQEEFVSFYRQQSSEFTDHELKWEEYVDAVARLDPVSSLVRAEFYDAEAEILAEESELAQVQISGVGVEDADQCDEGAGERIEIIIPLQDVVAEVLRNDSAALPVCRYLDEGQLRLRSDCELDEAHLVDSSYTEARCLCSHLTFFDVGWSDFIPRPSRIQLSTVEQVTLANLSDYPQGGYVLLAVSLIYTLMFLFAWWVDKRYMAQYRQRAKETFQKFVLFTDSELLSPYIDDPRFSRTRKIKVVFWRMVRNYHKWVAIFLRDPRSNYLTRDRVTVVFAYVMSSFAISAIFYQSPRGNFANYLSLGVIISLTSGVPSYIFKYLYSRTQASKSQSRLGTRDSVPSFVPADDMPSLRRMLSTTFKSSVELTGKGGANRSRRTLSNAMSQRNVTLTFSPAAEGTGALDSIATEGTDGDGDDDRRSSATTSAASPSGAEKRMSLEPLREHKEDGEGETKSPKLHQKRSSVPILRRRSDLRCPSRSASALTDFDSTPNTKRERKVSFSISKSITQEEKSLSASRASDLEPPRRPLSPSLSAPRGDLRPPERPSSPSNGNERDRKYNLGSLSGREPSVSAASIGSIHDVDVDGGDNRKPSAIAPRDADGDEPLEATPLRQPKTERTKPLWHPRVKTLILFFVFLWTALCAFTVLLLSLDFDLPEPSVLSEEFYAPFRCGGSDVAILASTGDVLDDEGTASTAEQWLFSALIASAIDIFVSQPLWLIFNSAYRVVRFERKQRRAKRSLRSLRQHSKPPAARKDSRSAVKDGMTSI